MLETVPTKKPQVSAYVDVYVQKVIEWLAEQDDRTVSKFVGRQLKQIADEAINSNQLPDQLMDEIEQLRDSE
ncbi:hypothetical protein [Leptothoe kymatousa]|uniref:CopG family transcriptional regulator n=1 Tax=Leptothoe kymatousa TAU-MAC 1615 TaxID=2364775 RepID=A0ABS5Y443_9CYAN|nr:hypothetical protein [Leptothoe kymatousa]MBT9312561.1 hypothetical protein [Leptothoe kymatousa TAU-MAC 1615]